MNLDKSRGFEAETEISPPMRRAITLPVEGVPGAVVYIAEGMFGPRVDLETLQLIAKRLRLA